MTAADSRPVFHLPARDIPVPSSISEQAMLALAPLMSATEYPALDVSPDDRRVYLDIHCGAWILGGGKVCRATAVRTAPIYGAGTGGGLPEAHGPRNHQRPPPLTSRSPPWSR